MKPSGQTDRRAAWQTAARQPPWQKSRLGPSLVWEEIDGARAKFQLSISRARDAKLARARFEAASER